MVAQIARWGLSAALFVLGSAAYVSWTEDQPLWACVTLGAAVFLASRLHYYRPED